MGECNGRALNGEGGAFCSESGTINTHIHTAHSHSFTPTCQLRLPDTYIRNLRKHAWLVCPQIGATKQCLLTHSYTYHTQNVLTSCSPVDSSSSWLWWWCKLWCIAFIRQYITKMSKVTRKHHHMKSAAKAKNDTVNLFMIAYCSVYVGNSLWSRVAVSFHQKLNSVEKTHIWNTHFHSWSKSKQLTPKEELCIIGQTL